MKKRFCLVASVILCLSILAGCGKNLLTGSVPDESFSIPENRIKSNRPGIYTSGISADLSDNTSISANIQNGVIFLDISSPDSDTAADDIRLINANSGIQLFRKEIARDSRRLGQLKNGGFYELSLTDGSVTEYTVDGKKETYGAIKDEPLLDGLVSPDGKYICCLRKNNNDEPCFLFDIKKRKKIFVKNSVFGFLSGADNNSFYLKDLDNKTWKIGYDGVSAIINSRAGARLTPPYFTESNEVGYIVQNLTTNDLLSFENNTQNDYIVAAGDGVLLSQNDDAYKLYDLIGGRFTDTFALEGTYLTSSYSSDGYFALFTENNGKLLIYLLVPAELEYSGSLNKTGGTYEGFENAFFEKPDIDKETGALLDSIYEKYHVRIILKSRRFEENICNYTCAPINDDDIKSKVRATDEFLSLFPRNMMQEINDGADIWLYLCNDIKTSEENRAAGFASMFSGHPFVAVESNGKDIYFEELLAHEFCHLLDYGISSDWLSNWDSLSPKDGYCYRMSDIPGKYSLHNTDGSEVYFYDVYSTTYPTEDRAVIFQKLFYEHMSGEKLPELHNGHLAEKVTYLGKMLRANYQSCKKSDKLFWE